MHVQSYTILFLTGDSFVCMLEPVFSMHLERIILEMTMSFDLIKLAIITSAHICRKNSLQESVN